MERVPLTRERKAQLDAYAARHGQDAASALDEVLADALEQDKRDFERSVAAIRQGHGEVKTGNTQPAAEFFREVRTKYGFPR